VTTPYEFGKEAEAQAVDYLVSLGYTIITRRFRTRRGEIDLVALEEDQLIFVEVKARRGRDHVPEEAITRSKLEALNRAAHSYLEFIGEPERGYRLDLIAIDARGLRHYRDLFEDA
jgi:putative endonuclease